MRLSNWELMHTQLRRFIFLFTPIIDDKLLAVRDTYRGDTRTVLQVEAYRRFRSDLQEKMSSPFVRKNRRSDNGVESCSVVCKCRDSRDI